LTLAERAAVARANVVGTYVTLAAGLAETQVMQQPGWIQVRSPIPLTLCNFWIQFDLQSDQFDHLANEILAATKDAQSFRLFIGEGDTPQDLAIRVSNLGMRLSNQLHQMVWTGAPPRTSVELHFATTADARYQVVRFMSEEFFRSQPRLFRDSVIQATVQSGLGLAYVGALREPEAAVMLTEFPESCGLYNLVVRPSLRRKGLGEAVVRAVQAYASQKECPLVLQTAPRLLGWYEKSDFLSAGDLKSFAPSGRNLL